MGNVADIWRELLMHAVDKLTGRMLEVIVSGGETRLSFETWRELPQSDLAEEMGCGQATISRAMKRLVDVGWTFAD